MNYNKAIIAGRVCHDPQLRKTPGGMSVLSMTVASNRAWTDKGGNKQETAEFHNVVVWGVTAENASTFLKKGSTVLVEGRLETRSWEDKNGATRKITEIVAEVVEFGPRPPSAEAKPAANATDKPRSSRRREPLIPLEDEEGTGRAFQPAFGTEEEIRPDDIPF